MLFIEKISPALKQVDSSSGAIGTAVNNALDELVPNIAMAPALDEMRDKWLDRLWQAFLDDQMPYIEVLADYWGELCVTPQRAARWADDLLPGLLASWTDRRPGSYFKGTAACLSCMLAAGRLQELLDILEKAPFVWWHQRQYGVRALAAMGRIDAAIEYAESSLGLNDSPVAMAKLAEEILLANGRWQDAYTCYAIQANQGTNRLATFRAIAKKYPDVEQTRILADLIKSTPGEEGKWFATAKNLKLYDLAVQLIKHPPCDPKTLNRAARDHVANHAEFAREVALASLRWLCEGFGYEITALDVQAPHTASQ
ncbi:hypothetical protein MYX84_14365 [Acidobacteria bacterium AH-259-O06]|nr:hypothetical protein [Acidobacteria bacterium AH-259-O06]